MDDIELKRLVEEELEWAPHVDASDVKVAVRDGIVRLTGFVSSLAEKRSAERAVWHVHGVRGIAEDIEVLIPEARQKPDDEIAHHAVNVLRWDAQIPEERIQVKVERGVVTLMGAVDWQFQKADAEERIHKLAGVSGIDNRIVVHPAALRKDIRAEIERAILRHATLRASGISVGVDGHKVILTGEVPSLRDRETAAGIARHTAGVTDVENRLVVQP